MKIDISSQRLRQDKSALTTFGHIKMMTHLAEFQHNDYPLPYHHQ